jgi:hypothetical protein
LHKGLPSAFRIVIETIIESMIESFGQYELADEIVVQSFQIELEGIVFGLIPSKESEVANLESSRGIAFYSPWDMGVIARNSR